MVVLGLNHVLKSFQKGPVSDSAQLIENSIDSFIQ